MKEVKDVTFLVIDCGAFIPFARRLAEEAKRVIWYNPERRQYPRIQEGGVGDGFPDLEHTLDFWPLLPEVDCVCFPDIWNAGLQEHLEGMGMPVWGARGADKIEINRGLHLKTLEKLGLTVPDYVAIDGIFALSEYLRDRQNLYIKISKWRGNLETFHWRNWAMDSGILAKWWMEFGPFARHLTFYVFAPIDTPLEIGGDTYNILGQWPAWMLNGLEHKDTTYFSAVTAANEMPQQLQEVLEAFGPVLGDAGMIGQWSMEVRVKDGKSYFNDPTPRGGLPSSASQQLIWKNFPEIVWGGANGELVQPDPAALFTIECMVSTKSRCDWTVVELPKELDRNVRFSDCAYVDGCYAFPEHEGSEGLLGWLCATGNTPRETLDNAKALADELPDGLNADLENLVSLIKEIDEAEKQGIPVTEEPMPDPAEVISDT